MIPIRDANRLPVFPVAVYAIVALNVAIFIKETAIPTEAARDAFINAFALIPFDVASGVQLAAPAPPTLATLITSQFLHGSVLHLFFNMLFLAVFGPDIEYLTGHLRFVIFYLACGVCGALAQLWATPGSHVPSIGASGAIAGVLGAYIVRFPLSDVHTIVPIGCFPLFLRLPAILVIGLWASVQFLHGFTSISGRVLSEQGGGIAYFAHIGGFLSGVFLIAIFGVRRATLVRRRYRYYYR